MGIVTLSSKNQIVVPAEVRRKLKLKSGGALAVYPVNEHWAILSKQPKKEDYVESMAGLGKEIWDELGGAERFIENERNSWGDR